MSEPGGRSDRIDRFFCFFSVDDREHRGSKIATFQVLVLLIVALHEVRLGSWIGAAIPGLCALLALRRPWRRSVVAVVLLWSLARHFGAFPWIANHSYLEVLVLALACGLDESKEEEQALLLQSLLCLTILAFFWAGFQKLWYGYYFDGRFLVLMAAQDLDLQTTFELILSKEDLARLRSYRGASVAGPFLVDSPLFVAISNLAWLTELALAALLLILRTRALGVLAGVVTMLVIEFVAREVVFGLQMTALICLAARRDLNRMLLPVYGSVMLYMLGSSLGWLPLVRWN